MAIFNFKKLAKQIFDKDILYPDKKRAEVTQELSRYIETIEYGTQKLNKGYSNRLLCELYRVLSGVEPVNNDSYFRGKQLFDIPGVYINIESYNPTAPEDNMPVMIELEKYMRSKQPVDELIKIGLFIYQFITISPFDTDNKKLGRILNSVSEALYMATPLILFPQTCTICSSSKSK